MVGWHHQLNGQEFEQIWGDAEGQGSLACCSPWGHKESDMTQQLNNKENQLSLGIQCSSVYGKMQVSELTKFICFTWISDGSDIFVYRYGRRYSISPTGGMGVQRSRKDLTAGAGDEGNGL